MTRKIKTDDEPVPIVNQDFKEGSLTFSFPGNWVVCRPENCTFYTRHFQGFCGGPNEKGCKEVDFLAYDPAKRTLWFIEVKDYRIHFGIQEKGLPHEVALKTRDVITMLPVAKIRDNAQSSPGRMQIGEFWIQAEAATQLRVVLHCELPKSPSKLFPGVIDAANLQDNLRRELRYVDRHALYTSLQHNQDLPWTVS